MNTVVGLVLLISALAAGALWWSGRAKRQERGILPLHLPGPLIDFRGQPVPWKKSMEAFIAHWQLLLGIWLLFIGIGFVLLGE